MTTAVPAASTRSASRWSWWVTPWLASMTNSAASARSTACERAHEAEVLGRLVDAAAAAHPGGVHEPQRPVFGLDDGVDACRASSPGRSCTTARSSPTRRLNNVDLPTFGRPTIATLKMPSPPSSVALPHVGRFCAVAASGGSASTTASSRSPLPRPWIAETAYGITEPETVRTPRRRPRGARRRPCSTTTITGLPGALQDRARPARPPR